MMIESDMIVAYSKRDDWLKKYATPLFDSLKLGNLRMTASAASLIELYYVLEDLGFERGSILTKQAEITAIKGLTIFPLTTEVLLAAQSLMRSFKLTGLFDSIFAAAALNQDSEKKILSTDEVYDRVAGVTRVDPRDYTP